MHTNEYSALDTEAYLQRIGYAGPLTPTLDTLRALQLQHVQSIAFENLSPLLGMPVLLDPASLQRKLLLDGRGGYCFELNLSFLHLLQALGFDASGLTARVVMGGPEDAPTARTHMLLLVEIDGVRHVADVGFGGMTPTGPLLLDSEDAQETPHEPFRIATLDDGRRVLRARVGDAWRGLYAFDLLAPAEIDYTVANWYVSTHPESHFTRQLVAARPGPGVRHALRNGELAIHRIGMSSEHRRLVDADAVIVVLRDVFGVRVPEHPRLREVLQRLIAA